MDNKINGLSYSLAKKPFNESLTEELTQFYNTLSCELDTFLLPLGKILSANLLSILRNEDGNIVGIAGIRPTFIFKLFFILLKKEYQGKGLGGKITTHILSAHNKFTILLLTVEKDNIKAKKIYLRHGFTIINQYKNIITMVHNQGSGRIFKWPLTLIVMLKNYKTIFRPSVKSKVII